MTRRKNPVEQTPRRKVLFEDVTNPIASAENTGEGAQRMKRNLAKKPTKKASR